MDESKRLEQPPSSSTSTSLQRPDSTSSPMSASISTSVSASMSASRSGGPASFGVPSRLQKERIADVMAMVEREGVVIDAAMKRLERLKVEY